MRILLTGATGFIGSHILEALLREGHRVVMVSRRPLPRDESAVQSLRKDFSQAVDPGDWEAALQGIDVVINAVGILRERGTQRFETLHYRAPAALFQAAVAAGVKRIVQVSALGADDAASTPYHLSKKAADDVLRALPVEGIVVQPSLVFGPGGASTTMFTSQATQPFIPLPGTGAQGVQPVHIEDLVDVVVRLATRDDLAREYAGNTIAVVGPQPMTLREYYRQLRRALGEMGPARFVSVPIAVMRVLAWAGQWIPGSPLDPDTLSMLERGSVAAPNDTQIILGRQPRSVAAFLSHGAAADLTIAARLRWLTPILRISVALVWLIAGVVSMGLYPVEDSLAMLIAVGVPLGLAPAALYGAATLDIFFGLWVLSPWRSKWLWALQMVVVIAYTLVLTLKLPAFWLHPFGPLAKNLPFLAVLWLLYEIDREP